MVEFQGLAAEWFAVAKRLEATSSQAWGTVEAISGYWTMLDLKGSAAYRQKGKSRRAFIRAEVFARLIKTIVRGDPSATQVKPSGRVFKELGDGVLMFSTGFRPAFEMAVLMDAISRQWATEVENDPTYLTLEHRTAITFGEAHIYGEDFIGEPIDRLARIAAYRTPDRDVVAVVGAEVAASQGASFRDEYPFTSFSEQKPLDSRFVKPAEEVPWISELSVDRTQLRGFEHYFDMPLSALRLRSAD